VRRTRGPPPKLNAARQLADEIEGLSQEEREQLTTSLDDLVRDTPMTEVAAMRFKRLMAKAKGEGVALLRASVPAMAPEAAKTAIFGPH
jgi:hypothetical protein